MRETGPFGGVPRKASVLTLGALTLVGLFLLSRANYLLFHSFVEIFSVIIACAVFALFWNTRRLLENSYYLFVGIAYLFVGIIDFVHTLA